MNPELQRYFDVAVATATQGVDLGQGGPFGAVVVHEGTIVGSGNNRVISDLDPTAHAEVVAIRQACRTLGRFSLEGCVLVSTCEPCPMCLAASHWARLERVYYAATRDDAASAGFDDALLYAQATLPPEQRTPRVEQTEHPPSRELFGRWLAKADRVPY